MRGRTSIQNSPGWVGNMLQRLAYRLTSALFVSIQSSLSFKRHTSSHSLSLSLTLSLFSPHHPLFFKSRRKTNRGKSTHEAKFEGENPLACARKYFHLRRHTLGKTYFLVVCITVFTLGKTPSGRL